ncbi:uncharacterized protein [Littorina saxatilis]|uniref:uncharacterized protein n=1 Tax=Littorina saxatilis TaxID=31220 RepID=UPI0038B52F44
MDYVLQKWRFIEILIFTSTFVLLLIQNCVHCETAVRTPKITFPNYKNGFQSQSKPKWSAKTPVRTLLNVGDSEKITLFPKAYEAVIDAGKNPGNYNNVSVNCTGALMEYSRALEKRDTWAIRIMDSSGKQGPGLLMGGMTQHGNYDECLNTRRNPQLEPRDTKHVREAQFCTAFFVTPSWILDYARSLDVPYPPKLPRVTVDLCIPSTCTTADLLHIVTVYMSSRSHNVSVEGVECHQVPNFAEDTAAVVVVSVFSTILLLVVLGTCLDVLQNIKTFEILAGEETRVGFHAHENRLSRFRSSIVSHWHRLGGGEYKPITRRNTIGYKPSIIRRFSSSIIRRRPSAVDDLEQTIYTTRGDAEGRGKVTTATMAGGQRNSHGIPSFDCNGIQLRNIKSSATILDTNENSIEKKKFVDADKEQEGRQSDDCSQNADPNTNSNSTVSDNKVTLSQSSASYHSPSVTTDKQEGCGQQSAVLLDLECGTGDIDTDEDVFNEDTVAGNSGTGKFECASEENFAPCDSNTSACQASIKIVNENSGENKLSERQETTTDDNFQNDLKCDAKRENSYAVSYKEDTGTDSCRQSLHGNPDCSPETNRSVKGDQNATSGVIPKGNRTDTCDEKTSSDDSLTNGTDTVNTGSKSPTNKTKFDDSKCDNISPESGNSDGGFTRQVEHSALGSDTNSENRETHDSSSRMADAPDKVCCERKEEAQELENRETHDSSSRMADAPDKVCCERKEEAQEFTRVKNDGDTTTDERDIIEVETAKTSGNMAPNHFPELPNLVLGRRYRPKSAKRSTKRRYSDTNISISPTSNSPKSRFSDSDIPSSLKVGCAQSDASSKSSKHNPPTLGCANTDLDSTPSDQRSNSPCGGTDVLPSPTKHSPQMSDSDKERNVMSSATNESTNLRTSVTDVGQSSTKHRAKSCSLKPDSLILSPTEQMQNSCVSKTDGPTLSPTKLSLRMRFQEADCPSSPTNTIQSSLSHSLTSIPEETAEEVRKSVAAGETVEYNAGITPGGGTKKYDAKDNVRFRRKGEKKTKEGIRESGLKVEMRRKTHRTEDVEGGTIPKRKSPVAEVLLCFSFLRSVHRVMAEGNADHLFSLNGVRVLSISWIVLGNTLSLLHGNPASLANNVDTVTMATTVWFQALMNATFAADTFFVLSGCLLAYHFLRSKSKELKQNPRASLLSAKSLILFYVHRLTRLLPCYYIALATYTVLVPYFGNGPLWKGTDSRLARCHDHWWANALFFSNFYKANDMCMSWSYYLVNDLQFYFISPLFLYPLLYLPRLGLSLLVALVMIQILSTALLTQDINGNMLSMEVEFFAQVYAKPYCRVGAFAVGMGLGYFLHSTERRIFFRKVPLLLGLLSALSVVATVVYITHTETGQGGESWTALQTSLYEAVARPLWSLAVSFIIFVCSVGQGGFVHKLLSWNAFVPLCRITYGVYLLHPILIAVVLNGSRYPFHLHFGSLIYMFVGNLVCAYGLAFLLITLVESPFTSLEHTIRTRFF